MQSFFQINSKRQRKQLAVTLWSLLTAPKMLHGFCRERKYPTAPRNGKGGVGVKDALILNWFHHPLACIKEQGGGSTWATKANFPKTVLCFSGPWRLAAWNAKISFQIARFLFPVLWSETISLFIWTVDLSLASESNSSSLDLEVRFPRF